MSLRDLFKVRKPGHGEQFEKRVKNASASRKAEKFPSHDNSFNSKKIGGVK
jgi:hypothetical protein